MSKSIRVSDRLYDAAEEKAQLLTRSVPEQIEHWANVGMALEAAGVSVAHVCQILKVHRDDGDLVMSLVKSDRQKRSRDEIRSGKVKQSDQHLISPSDARKAKIQYKG